MLMYSLNAIASADDLSPAEAMAFSEYISIHLMGVQCAGWVGERRVGSEAPE